MYKIAKEFAFCYGHRVWSQKLNEEFSLDNKCVCRHLHGHQGKVIVYLEGEELTDGMVTDFKHLNWFKKFLDDALDHKFIIDKNDPMYNAIIPQPAAFGLALDSDDNVWPMNHNNLGYSIINPNVFKFLTNEEAVDILEGFVVVDFVPTSENLSAWMHKIAQAKMDKLGVKVAQIAFFETPKSQSNYYA